jgi:alkylation response protein AidB-like acyl-CoA dehydrogenase
VSSAADPTQTALRDEILGLAARLTAMLGKRAGGTFADAWQDCARAGLLGMTVPAQFGGRGYRHDQALTAMMALGYGCRDNGFAFSLATHQWACVVPLWRFGDDATRRAHLPGLLDGSRIGAFAVTEETAGSETAAMVTAAVRRGTTYVLNGTKTYITNAPVAQTVLLIARSGSAAGHGELTAFLLDTASPGCTVGPAMDASGLAGAPLGSLRLEDVAVPAGAVLGRPGQGQFILGVALELERTYTFAAGLGFLRRMLDETVDYTRTRRQFGGPVSRFQAIAHPLVNEQVNAELAELLLRRISRLHDDGRRAYREAAMAKLIIGGGLARTALLAVRSRGAHGFTSAAGREVNDALASTIYSGTSEIQRNIIGSFMGL